MKVDGKTTYAQSSDIKSRTYLEYRKDMKQKAIVELEILTWLKKQFKQSSQSIEKFGGDKFLWFLRKGHITREPDYLLREENGAETKIEFQYAKEELNNYDFKVSKIASIDKHSKKRVPKHNMKILYIVKPLAKFSFIDPEWIVKNGKTTVAPAWGNAPVYRVPQNKFKKILQYDMDLKTILAYVDQKLFILNFQHKAINNEEEKLSHLLQTVVDEEKTIKIIPKTLDGFFKDLIMQIYGSSICFLF